MKILFVITSTIHVGNTKTIFTPEERLNQTVTTINSIKNKIKDAEIYLFESSVLSNEEYNILNSTGANIIQCNNDFVGERSKNENQSIGEIAITNYGLEYLVNNNILYNFDFLFKISGRYYLDDNFDLNKLTIDNNKYVFRQFTNDHSAWLSTMLYCVGRNMFDNYIKVAKNGINNIAVNIEQYYKSAINNKDILYVDVIGGSGKISHCGELVSH